eukprot:gnl/TRDRNA2_/TRDRNA2_85442_c0_seq1.p1 gnl/TRDRNA2_/TRDRNA2_85442_c0~~gnl/TRDRNA2_/TRDRNA2_85442_c0_seq1.p1  ORF type:complete len:194 (+),score=24.01 gnl/TRDRNA2_/TRDRNA2_85442_c0_seq1:83-664(+)
MTPKDLLRCFGFLVGALTIGVMIGTVRSRLTKPVFVASRTPTGSRQMIRPSRPLQLMERRYKNGAQGEGASEARKMWIDLLRRTNYDTYYASLPWAFTQWATLKQQEGSLQMHAEKKALCVLLTCSEGDLLMSIEFNACIDCHKWFKNCALTYGCRIQLKQPKLVHTFTDGDCSCRDRWRWEARIQLQGGNSV